MTPASGAASARGARPHGGLTPHRSRTIPNTPSQLTEWFDLEENDVMETTPNNGIPRDVMAELEEAADRAAKGIRDPEAMQRACERMDRMREELRQRSGELNVAVDLVREIRDEE